MNTRTTLKTLLLTTALLSPVAFAGGVEAKPAAASDAGVVCAAVALEHAIQDTAAVSRAALQRIDAETRQQALESLRGSRLVDAAVQAAVPASGVGARNDQKFRLTVR